MSKSPEKTLCYRGCLRSRINLRQNIAHPLPATKMVSSENGFISTYEQTIFLRQFMPAGGTQGTSGELILTSTSCRHFMISINLFFKIKLRSFSLIQSADRLRSAEASPSSYANSSTDTTSPGEARGCIPLLGRRHATKLGNIRLKTDATLKESTATFTLGPVVASASFVNLPRTITRQFHRRKSLPKRTHLYSSYRCHCTTTLPPGFATR